MKNAILPALALVLPLNAAIAQIKIAPEFGLNLSTYTASSKYSEPVATVKPGFRLGAVGNIPLGGGFYLQPSVAFVQNGYVQTEVDNVNIATINSIEIPVNVTYKHNGFFVGAGEYSGINVSGKRRNNGFFNHGESPIEIGGKPGTLRRAAMGFSFTTGYETPGGFFARAYYQQGITNENTGDPEIYGRLHHTSFGLATGYFIGKKATPKNPGNAAKRSEKNVRLAIQAGGNLSNYACSRGRIRSADYTFFHGMQTNKTRVAPMLGFRAGVAAEMAIDKNAALQTALSFVTNGTKSTTEAQATPSSIVTTSTISTIELPLHFVYKVKRFFIGAGPYVALNISNKGTYAYNGETTPLKPQMKLNNSSYFKAWDGGLSAVLGYAHKSGLFIKAHYQAGLLPAYADDDIDYRARVRYNANCGLTLGYFLGKKNS